MSIYFVYFYSLIILISLEISLLKPNFFLWASFLIILFNIFFVWLAARRRFNIEFFNFLISPFLFILSGLLFLSFSDNFLFKEISIIFLMLISSMFLRRLILYNYYKYQYKAHSLSNISIVMNLSSIFFFYADFFNLHSFLKVSIWSLLIFSWLVVTLIIYQFFNINKIKTNINQIFIFISSLVLVEIFYVLNWLPLISYAKAILIVSIYYFIINLTKHYFKGTLVQQVYSRYFLIVGIIWLLVLLTARWA